MAGLRAAAKIQRWSIAGLCLVLLVVCQAQDYDYDYDYESYDTESSYYEEYDDYGYYADDDEAYYEYYGYYADDFAGYEDYYDEEEYYEEYNAEDCTVGADGKVELINGTTSCDLKIDGVDKQADQLPGGIDGLYTLVGCNNGRPMYRRKDSPAGEDRVLWYSHQYGDWDVAKGTEPNEVEILMYGGEVEHASVPLYVSSWHLGADLNSGSDMDEDDYMPIAIKLTCADGKVPEQAAQVIASQARGGPVLTDDEMEAKYRYIYEKYGRRPEPSPTVNFTFVVLMVMSGLTIVLAIPYFLLKKKGAKAPKQEVTSFATLIQQSKKKQSGHVN